MDMIPLVVSELFCSLFFLALLHVFCWYKAQCPIIVWFGFLMRNSETNPCQFFCAQDPIVYDQIGITLSTFMTAAEVLDPRGMAFLSLIVSFSIRQLSHIDGLIMNYERISLNN